MTANPISNERINLITIFILKISSLIYAWVHGNTNKIVLPSIGEFVYELFVVSIRFMWEEQLHLHNVFVCETNKATTYL